MGDLQLKSALLAFHCLCGSHDEKSMAATIQTHQGNSQIYLYQHQISTCCWLYRIYLLWFNLVKLRSVNSNLQTSQILRQRLAMIHWSRTVRTKDKGSWELKTCLWTTSVTEFNKGWECTYSGIKDLWWWGFILEKVRTPENPPRGLCQGPDKFLTFGLDVCADLDNFRVQNLDMYVSQSGQFGAAHGGLCQSPDNFGRGKPSLGTCQWRW